MLSNLLCARTWQRPEMSRNRRVSYPMGYVTFERAPATLIAGSEMFRIHRET